MEHQKLFAWEEKCTQGLPPACTAACPVHVDVKGFLAEMKAGRFDRAMKILRQALPFPGIIGRICDHPCQDACKRREAGRSHLYSRSGKGCVMMSSKPPVKISVQTKKDKRVAVGGSGLSGLTAAHDLATKGYSVVLFESKDRLGGSLWDIPEQILPRDVILSETAVLEKLGVEIRFNTTVGKDISLADLCRDFDAVYMGTGRHSQDTFNLQTSQEGRIQIDPVAFSTSQEGVFAGGRTAHWRGILADSFSVRRQKGCNID